MSGSGKDGGEVVEEDDDQCDRHSRAEADRDPGRLAGRGGGGRARRRDGAQQQVAHDMPSAEGRRTRAETLARLARSAPQRDLYPCREHREERRGQQQPGLCRCGERQEHRDGALGHRHAGREHGRPAPYRQRQAGQPGDERPERGSAAELGEGGDREHEPDQGTAAQRQIAHGDSLQ